MARSQEHFASLGSVCHRRSVYVVCFEGIVMDLYNTVVGFTYNLPMKLHW
jgi:hypothetical protein